MSATTESLIEVDAGPTTLPMVTHPVDTEVDVEVLKAVPKAFEITDQNSANWVVRRVVHAREYAVTVKAWAEAELRRAEREETTLLFLFGRQLERWAKGEVAKLKGRRKSIQLPAGKVGFRSQPIRLVVDDDAVVLVWAKENCPQAVQRQVIEKLSRTELKAHFEATGEVPVEGAHVEPEAESFFVG